MRPDRREYGAKRGRVVCVPLHMLLHMWAPPLRLPQRPRQPPPPRGRGPPEGHRTAADGRSSRQPLRAAAARAAARCRPTRRASFSEPVASQILVETCHEGARSWERSARSASAHRRGWRRRRRRADRRATRRDGTRDAARSGSLAQGAAARAERTREHTGLLAQRARRPGLA